ncbi:APC family permease [Bdellovibrio bacteriovorus]|uniref:APC family permease n=1 Tax=Bdellovibrio bacteriovorus TaxID=959 RepID=UPI0035A998ED
MKKVLSFANLTLYGIGMIVGAGIYSVIGKAAGVAEETLGLSFLLAGGAAFLTALSYAELSSMFPKAGAEYIYLKNIFPSLPILSFVCGSMMVVAGVCTAATVATAFSGYVQETLKFSFVGLSFVVLLLFSLLNIWGLKESSRINAVFTMIEVCGLVLFILMGVRSENFGQNLSFTPESKTFSGAAMIIFAYFGFENIVNFAEETRDPQKQLPRAIFLSVTVAGVLYILVSLSALALMNPAELAQSEGPLGAALQKTSMQAAYIVGGIAIFSTSNTVLISILSTSRIVFSMARENDLPALFKKQTKNKETPWVASLLVLTLASLMLPAGGIAVIASVSSFATMLAFSIVNLALIHLRFTEPERDRPFRVPGHIGRMPIAPLLAFLTSLGLIFFFQKQVYFVGGALIGLILLFYFIRTKRNFPKS